MRLSRFYFVVSHIALKLLVYTESLSGAVRNASAARTLSKQEQADKARRDSEEDNDEEEGKRGKYAFESSLLTCCMRNEENEDKLDQHFTSEA